MSFSIYNSIFKNKQALLDFVIYGTCLAILLIGLRMAQFKFLIYHHSIEIYTGLIALLFTVFGLWLASHISFTKKKYTSVTDTVLPDQKLEFNKTKIEEIGLSIREMEILQLIIEGHSNQEIASLLFISLSTVKSHVSNLFSKLNVKRRTQAIEAARQLRIYQE